jgi:hypothetical protein
LRASPHINAASKRAQSEGGQEFSDALEQLLQESLNIAFSAA